MEYYEIVKKNVLIQNYLEAILIGGKKIISKRGLYFQPRTRHQKVLQPSASRYWIKIKRDAWLSWLENRENSLKQTKPSGARLQKVLALPWGHRSTRQPKTVLGTATQEHVDGPGVRHGAPRDTPSGRRNPKGAPTPPREETPRTVSLSAVALGGRGDPPPLKDPAPQAGDHTALSPHPRWGRP